jgi:hypothetical protein
MKISRELFVRRTIRVLMLMFLAFLAFALGTRSVSGRDCSGCPVRGNCTDESKCSENLQKAK